MSVQLVTSMNVGDVHLEAAMQAFARSWRRDRLQRGLKLFGLGIGHE